MAQQLGYAVVTGASSGIGADFAKELAGRGYDLILTARRRDRLEQLQSELQAAHNIHVDLVVADLSQPTGADELFQSVQALSRRVTFLANNAGLGHYGEFLSQTLADVHAMIDVNISALTTLTHRFAGQMVADGGGHILNTASFSAIQPPSDLAVYAGTKSYVLAFSQALNQQLRNKKVRVCALCPGFFQSEFFERANFEPSFMVRLVMLNRLQVARAGIRGVLRGRSVVIPGVGYKLLNLLMRMTPRTFATELADFACRH